MKKLILMHGCPGSGKSTLAKKIYDQAIKAGLTSVILSTDNLFMVDGVYKFDPSKLKLYHKLNQNVAEESIRAGIDVVIIDNTNTTASECRPYVTMAIMDSNDYCVHLMEPVTEWRYDLEELVKRNTHNVPRESIQKMLDRWQDSDTILEQLAEELACDYDFVNETLFKELE